MLSDGHCLPSFALDVIFFFISLLACCAEVLPPEFPGVVTVFFPGFTLAALHNLLRFVLRLVMREVDLKNKICKNNSPQVRCTTRPRSTCYVSAPPLPTLQAHGLLFGRPLTSQIAVTAPIYIFFLRLYLFSPQG
ncbi:hypothetical protein TNIN_460931 [Trichonephila inaurata madagascariensis]|uniref:Uncharacterized protein n=1 Tax=Trichonephila inaurata madagascariensis TaxID=2747483 RepID=A0A8X7BPE6_9ARAC|nr:hypothetical protein TNIN_460931 [Trichonephila inaurata madagascariensis]